MISAPLARIILRYLAATLVTSGLVGPDIGEQLGADPDLVHLLAMAIGAGIALLTERSWLKSGGK